jgi:hypothetical protein
MNSKTAIASVALACAFAMLPSPTYLSAYAQDATNFTPATQFTIPASNGTITFATSGSYETASLNNNTWNFVGFALNTTGGLTLLPGLGNNEFSVSAINCNITIIGPTYLNGLPPVPGWLNYTIVGVGTQAFNMYYERNMYFNEHGVIAEWTVYIDGVNRAQNDGWTITSDGWLNITGATNSVSIHTDNIGWVEAKIRDFQAQGLNDTQIAEKLSEIGVQWNPETGAWSAGTPVSSEELAHMPLPNWPTTPPNFPSPISTITDPPSLQVPTSVSLENFYVFYAALAFAIGILIIVATALVIRKTVIDKI